MSVAALISLANAVTAMVMGDLVFDEDRRSPLNRSFGVLCGFLVIWAFSEFMYRQADSYATARLWVDVNKFSWRFTVAGLGCFALIYAGRPRFLANKYSYAALCGSAALLGVIDLTTNLFSRNPVRQLWGYTYYPPNTIPAFLDRLWAVSIGMTVVAVMAAAFVSSEGARRQQSKIIFVGFLIPVAAGILEVATQALRWKVPEPTTASFTWLALFVGYAVWRYQLFSVNPAAAASDILATMTDALVLLDPEGRVTTINRGLKKMLGCEEADLVGKPLCSVFANEKSRCELHGKLVGGEVVDSEETVLLTARGTEVPVLFSATPIRDRSGDIAGVVAVAKNISELKIYEEILREERDRALKYLEIAGVLVVALNTDGTVAMINKKGCELLGYDASRIIGRDWFEGFLPDQVRAEARNRFNALPAEGVGWIQYYEEPIVTRWGEERLIAWHFAALRNEHGEVTAVLGSGEDLADRRRAETFEHLAHYDYLTNLPNRALLADRLNQALAFADRGKKMIAVFFLDIDDFKGVNDMFGHDTGDRFLRVISGRLADGVRRGDTVARLGGDEFALVLTNVNSPDEAAVIADKIIRAAAAPYVISGYEIRVSTSIGISMYPQDGDDPDSLIQNADSALMLAKELGKNNYQFYIKQAA